MRWSDIRAIPTMAVADCRLWVALVWAGVPHRHPLSSRMIARRRSGFDGMIRTMNE